MRSSIASFRWMQSSVKCPWHLWNRQYLVLSTPFFSCEGPFGGLTPASFRSATTITTKIFSLDMAKGVYSVKRPVGPWLSRVALPCLLFLMERLLGGFSNRLLLPGFVEAVRVQLLFISYVDLGDR